MRVIWKIIKGFLITLGALWVVLFVLTLAIGHWATTETIDRSGPATLTVNS